MEFFLSLWIITGLTGAGMMLNTMEFKTRLKSKLGKLSEVGLGMFSTVVFCIAIGPIVLGLALDDAKKGK